MINILYAFISKSHHEDLMRQYLPEYPFDFQMKIKRYRRWEDAQLSLLGRILLFEGVKKFGRSLKPDAIKFTKYDKPYFANDSINFNISHSGELVACVICDDLEVGIDVELVNPIQIKDFKPQMTEKEWNNVILSDNVYNAFYRYWTEKESVIKAHGRGLSTDLNSFEIYENKTVIEGKDFFLIEVELRNNYMCNVATNKLISKVDVNHKEVKIDSVLTRSSCLY